MEKVHRGSDIKNTSQKTVRKIKIMVQSKTERDLTILLRYIKSTFGKGSFMRRDVLDFMEDNNIPNPIFNHLMNFGPFDKVAPRTYAISQFFKKSDTLQIVEFVATNIASEARNRHALKRAGDDGFGEPSAYDKSLEEVTSQKEIAEAIMLLKDNGFTISIEL